MNEPLLSSKDGVALNPKTMGLKDTPELSKGIAHISSYGIIRVSGEDSLSFLHNQLTQDFLNLGDKEARLCAFCNAKGRMQASFIGFKASQAEVLLVCSKDLIAQTVKRLSMFILRSKVKVTDETLNYQIYGVIGRSEPIKNELQPTFADSLPWQHSVCESDTGNQHWITLYPSIGIERYLCISPSSIDVQVDLITESQWNLSEVMSGVCLISHATYESFVPQMINYESLEGVNFHKGCYPGQEVVARSQFRGTIKRRGFLLTSVAPLHDGQDLFLQSDKEQPCGQIVRSASYQGIFYGFASLSLSATLDNASLIRSVSEGAEHAVEVLSLPYTLREDI